MKEHWNIGIMGKAATQSQILPDVLPSGIPNIPLFQHSTIPVFRFYWDAVVNGKMAMFRALLMATVTSL
jgi:hypothetical protein